ncbi:MAG: NAD(P)H-dependent oxidoreductase [Acidobacteriota bacterium]
MNVFIVYWHPEPQSFNAAMFQTACEAFLAAGNAVKTSDLHTMGFDPVSSRKNFTTIQNPNYFKPQLEEMHATEMRGFADEIETEIAKIEWCDVMVWQFPLWWAGLPAVFKGWVDRVFALGRTYGNGRYYETGAFRGKRALLSLTAGGTEEAFRKGGFNGDMAGILRPIHRGILQFVGFEVLKPQIVYAPARLTEAQRKDELTTFSRRLQHLADESPYDVGIY